MEPVEVSHYCKWAGKQGFAEVCPWKDWLTGTDRNINLQSRELPVPGAGNEKVRGEVRQHLLGHLVQVGYVRYQ